MSDDRYVVEPHWQQWAVYDVLYVTPSRQVAGPFSTYREAVRAAYQLNHPRLPEQQLTIPEDAA